MHDAEGVKSTPRTADGLCRRVTINVHRPDTAPGRRAKTSRRRWTCTSVQLLSKHAVREKFCKENLCALPCGGGARAEQGRWAAAARAGAPAGAAAAAATDGARCWRLNRAAGSGR